MVHGPKATHNAQRLLRGGEEEEEERERQGGVIA